MHSHSEKQHHMAPDSHDGHSHHSATMGHMHHMHDFKQRFIISLLVTVPILLFSPSIEQWFGFSLEFAYKDILIVLLASFIYIYGGKPFLTMMVDEIRSGKPGMMTLISMAISVAYFYSLSTLFWYEGKAFFWELATLIDIMLIGHYIEAKSLLGASSALNELVELMPKKAMKVMSDDELEEVSVDQLQTGDLVLVHPGEKIPADGIVKEGQSMNDEAFLTGESKPVYKEPGSSVYTGGTNLDGALRIEITKSGKESYLSQVIALVEEASKSKSHTQDLANRAAGWLFYLAVGIAAVTFAVWAMITSSSDAVLKSVTVLIIACPHALGLAVPLVTAISTSLGAKHGILIRNRQAFERLGKVDVICFDKTGTITEGKLSVEKVVGLEDEKTVLYYASSLERNSEHSIAQAIIAYANKQKVVPKAVTEFVTYPGIGARAVIDGKEIMVGGMQLLEKESLDTPLGLLEYGSQDKSKVWVVVDGKIIGVILLTDTIRKNAKQAVSMLEKLGINAYMLTGDSDTVASDVAAKTGISHYEANLLPDEKLRHISGLKKEGKVVAMVGDGINDAPALLSADIGIAIGAGTDIAIESADIILTKSELLHVIDAIILSQKTYGKMVQNLWWASGYNIIAVPLAAGILSPIGIVVEPALGAILMSISTVVVALNAQLLKKALIR